MNTPAKEKRFLDALESLFTGAEVDGDSGFVNLMRMKRGYFRSIRPQLMERIDSRAEKETSFREELFDKLHTFFSRHFCESGSIYFRHLPAFSRIYERVYADGEDVALSWKTRMLYYVKSDVLVRSMPVELNEEDNPQNTRRFYFDASQIEHKKNNERREFVFTFDGVKSNEGIFRVVHLKVAYSAGGVRTKADDIIKQARKGGVKLTDEQLHKALSVFRRQTEADFFINKDAKGFLREQFDLWVYQYLFHGETVFEAKRIAQIQAIRDTAYDIIDFIAQFEDELRRAWEKPKFVRGVNYVVTLDKLTDAALKKITKHRGAKAQVKEWRELGLVNDAFAIKSVFGGQKKMKGNGVNGDCQFLPLDTKHFKDLELEILDGLGNLDEALDGELVHSENWQALNSLQAKYRGRVKCIYIDPPFNLGDSDQFDYRTNYKDSCWATMLENRISSARDFLADDGSIFVRCDCNGNWIVRCLLDSLFGKDNFKNEIIVNRTQEFFKAPTPFLKKLMNDVDSVILFGKSDAARINQLREIRATEVWHEPFLPSRNGNGENRTRTIDGKEYHAPNGRIWGLSQEVIDEHHHQGRIKVENGRVKYWPLWKNIKNNWTDIPGYSSTMARAVGQKFATENSERLLARVIDSGTSEGDSVLDFFSGSGTTQAVAQKSGRKWLGVEMGEHFNTVILPRIKKVLGGYASGNGNGNGNGHNADYKGGGAFKYYTLEQYEETLRNSCYQNGEQLELDSAKTPFEQYVFFADDKLAHAVAPKGGKLEINLQNLYPDIDIAESLSNALGKPIRRRTASSVTFTDDSTEKTDPATMTEAEKRHFISLIRPYLWWGE